MDYDRFAVAIGELRERLTDLPPSNVAAHIAVVLDFCRKARHAGQPIAVIRAVVDMKYFGATQYAPLRDRVLAAVDECFAEQA